MLPASDPPATLRHSIAALLDPAAHTLAARLLRTGHTLLILVGVLGAVLSTDAALTLGNSLPVGIPLVVFALEYLLRLWIVPEVAAAPDAHHPPSRRQWALSSLGLVDLASVVLIPAALLGGVASADAELFAVLWVFKLARYSQGLAVLGRVIRLESEPLLGVLFAFLVILLCAAVLAHVLERDVQPETFGSVPRALWWTIVTLTTTGYGDVTPATVPGRMLAGLVMMSGIVVFAMWAGILATGFSQEMRRLAFLRTWDLVARVPLFHDVGATVIAEVAQRLRPRDVGAGTIVVRRGDRGDCMYFIVSGEVQVLIEPQPHILRDGDFFGEIALITGARRVATAVAAQPTRLLVLDIADFRDLAARHPELTRAIHDEAGRRMRAARPDDRDT